MKANLVIFTSFHTELSSERKFPTENIRAGDKQNEIKQKPQNKAFPHLDKNF